MKKLLGIVVLGLLLSGSFPTTGKAIGQKGSFYWINWASHEDLVEYYSTLPIEEICHEWKKEGEPDIMDFRRKKTRKAMKVALKKIGEDPLICMKLQNL